MTFGRGSLQEALHRESRRRLRPEAGTLPAAGEDFRNHFLPLVSCRNRSLGTQL